jgi:iron(III) transport system permease protein
VKLRGAVPALVVAAVLVPSVAQPVARLVESSVEGDAAGRWWAILTRPVHVQALLRSFNVSILTVVIGALLGVPLAFVTRGLGMLGAVLSRLALAPLFLSPVLGTLSFHFLFGAGGVLRHFFPGLEWRFRGFDAVLIVHALTMFVYFFLFTSAALARIDPDVVHAARALGARPARVLRTVVLPLLGPALSGAAALTFMASMASFTAPYVFDTDRRYLTTAIINARIDDPATGSALAILLAAASILCASFFQRAGKRTVATTSKGTGPPPASGSAPVIAAKALVALVLVAAILLPIATLVLLSFKPGGRIGSEGLFADLTLGHYREVLASILSGDRSGPAGELMPSIGRSLVFAAVATALNLAFALVLVVGVPARWKPVRWAFFTLSMLPVAIPGTVLAIALLEAFSTAGPLGIGPPIAQSIAILPFAYFVRNLPVVVQATEAAAAQLPPSLPEASRTLGAGAFRTLFRVTLPLILPGVASGALIAFLVASGEFVASILLYTYRTQPAAVAIFSEYSQQEYGTAAAAGTVLMVVVLALGGIFSLLTSRRARSPGGS